MNSRVIPMKRKFDVLVIHPQTAPVYFVVPSFGPDEDLDTKKYMIEEGSCPVNFLRGVEVVVIEGDSDPHGLFELVKTIESDGDDIERELRIQSPELFTPSETQ